MKAIALIVLAATAAYPQNPLLKELAREDQASRSEGKKFARNDEDRVKLVLGALATGKVVTPEDKLNAALVLQHSPLAYCGNELTSHSRDNFLLAHFLFQAALDAGLSDARYLVAAALDRYLSFSEGKQKYGTNRIINQTTGQEEWVPIDRSTPDSERSKYGVPALAELLKRYPEKKP